MKKFLISSAVLALMTGSAYAQVSGGTGAGNEASANAGTGVASSTNGNDYANTDAATEGADAHIRAGGPGSIPNDTRARATVGNGVVASAVGNPFFGGLGTVNDFAEVGVSGSPANTNIQFQAGANNNAINMQDGSFNESATLQIGENNNGLVSQDGDANESAISQVGDNNNTVLIADGNDNAAASATWGNGNTSYGLQDGNDNILAHAQDGNNNNATTFQDGNNNTAASLQKGNSNTSFISQGGGLSFTLAAIDGSTAAASLPGFATVIGLPPGGIPNNPLPSGNNSAANLQLGDGNRSAILQYGTGNEAVNYQNHP